MLVVSSDKTIVNPSQKEDGIQTFELLGIVHFDICGPLMSTTHLGYKCFLTLINDFVLY
jgi:hypothetical protein